MQLIKQVKIFRNQCAHAVDRDCEYVVVHTSDEPEDAIATKFRQLDRIRNTSDCRTAVVYETTAAGVPQSNPSSNITPFKKENYNKLMRDMLNSKCPHENGKATSISGKDEYYIMDLREEGNHGCYIQPFVNGKQRMTHAVPKELLNIFEHESVMARAQKVRGTACSGWLEHQKTVIISRDTWGVAAEGNDRLLHEGPANSGNI